MKNRRGHNFAQVPNVDIPRSSFDRSHGLKTTFDGGYLIPIYVDEVLPGDSFSLNMTAFARLATPIKPIMDNIYLDTFFFFVPNRLVWNLWEKFNGAQDDPGDSTDYLAPWLTSPNPDGLDAGSVYDYMGLPPGVPLMSFSALPLRSYNLIWNTWFRDENLQDSLPVNLGGTGATGMEPLTDYNLVRRGKRHDYFTSCLPWPQKGDAVTIPIGATAPVTTGATPGTNTHHLGVVSNTDDSLYKMGYTGSTFEYLTNTAGDSDYALYADLADATAVTINDLRQAFQIQRLLERDARGGTRYVEILRSHFGVTSPDQRLQRPEYLGGGSSYINVSPVAQTQATEAGNTPQGNLSAIGTGQIRNHGFTKSFVEHGILIGLVSARAELSYQQGYHRQWFRKGRYDYYWPALAHIGEQAVQNRELYVQGAPDDLGTFGYQERYAEYRYKPSLVTAKFRSSDPQSLDLWHLAQDFQTLPVLGDTFIQDNPPIDRVVAVPSEPDFLLDAWFDLKCARPMPLYGVPGLIDHF